MIGSSVVLHFRHFAITPDLPSSSNSPPFFTVKVPLGWFPSAAGEDSGVSRSNSAHLLRRPMAGAALSAVSLLTMPGTLQAGEPGPQPNILVLLTDDIGWGDLRCYNPEGKIPTPAFDALAAAGMRFTDAHAPCAVCAPSRYSMVTGNYPWRGRTTTGAWKFDGVADMILEESTCGSAPGHLRTHGTRWMWTSSVSGLLPRGTKPASGRSSHEKCGKSGRGP